jgi:putative transposase
MQHAIQQGMTFLKNETVFVIENVIACTEMFTARNKKTHYQVSCSISDFINDYQNKAITILSGGNNQSGEISLTNAIPTKFTEEELELAEKRRLWIEACIDENSIWITEKKARDEKLFDYARSIGVKGKLPSDKTLKRWYSRWRAGGKTLDSLMERTSERGNRNQRLSDELKDLIIMCINSIYMNESRPSVSATHRIIEAKIKNEVEFSHLPFPSRSTVERMIKEISAYDRCKARHGWLEAQRRFPLGSPVKRLRYLMQEVELDHTPVNLAVRSQDRRVVIPNIWITLVIEKLTRMIVGYYIAAHAPSAISVIRAIKSTVTPKDKVLEQHIELDGENWPSWGLPAEVSMDNGSDLISKQAKNCLGQLGIVAHYNPKGRPNYKGKIENVLGTVNRQTTELLPGRTFADYIELGDYKADMKSIATMEDFEKIFLIWVVKHYHQNRHMGIKEKPVDAWQRMKMDAPPIRIANDTDFEKFLWKHQEKKLQKYGVDVNTFRYQSVELQNIAKQIGHGETVEVYEDHSDISVVHVRIPKTDQYIDAFAPSTDYMDLHLCMEDHLEVIKQAKILFKGENGKPLSATNMSPHQMHIAWLEILKIREASENATKKAEREKEVKRRTKSESKSLKKSEPKKGALTNNHDEVPITPNLEDL